MAASRARRPAGRARHHGITPGSHRWARVQEIFDGALELPSERREAYLDEACAGDATLRREVEELLAASADADDWFERLANQAGALFLHAPPPAIPLPAETGIGAYRVIRQIGQGGMGAVFLAERADGQFEMQVAIKLLPPGTQTSGLERRFRAERQILATLNHPGIARLLDGGVTPEGTPYFVMEHVDGEPIDAYCLTRNLPVPERLELFLQVADAVQYAHQAGVVHRDLKPSNILVTADGRVKLLDFGIAKVVEGEFANEVTQDEGGVSPLTLAYASPEQVAGQTVGYASDIYQLGLLLYRLLVGRGPITVTSAASPAEVKKRILEGDLTPPSEAITGEDDHLPAGSFAGLEPEALRAALTGPLDDIVLTAMQRVPTARYSSVQALAGDARSYLAGQAVTAPNESPLLRLRRTVRRNRIAASTVLLAAAAVLILLWPGAVTVADADDDGLVRIVIMPFRVSGDPDLQYLETGLVTLLSANLDGAGSVRIADAGVVQAQLREAGQSVVYPAAAAQVANRLGANHFLLGEVVMLRGTARLSAGLHHVAAPERVLHRVMVEGTPDSVLGLADQLSLRMLEHFMPAPSMQTAARTTTSVPALRHFVTGESHYRAGRYSQARDAFERAVTLDSGFALAFYRLSLTNEWGGFATVVETAEAAARAAHRLPEREARLVRALWGYRNHLDDSTEIQLRTLIGRQPDFIEARYLLAELQYHRWPRRGAGVRSSAEQYRQVLLLDPNHVQALSHLARIVALERDEAALAELVTRYSEYAEADAVRTLEMRALLAGLRGDTTEIEAVNRWLASETESRRWLTAFRLAVYSGNLGATALLLRPMLQSHVGNRGQFLGYYLLSLLDLASGRPAAARAAVPQFKVTLSSSAPVARATLALAPATPHDSAELRAVQGDLLAWRATAGNRLEFRHISNGLVSQAEPEARSYYLGRVALELGDLVDAERWLHELDSHISELAPLLAKELRARLAWERGDPHRALAIMEASGPTEGYPYITGSIILLSQLDARWLRAELLAEAGRWQEALGWYDAFEDDNPLVISYLPVAYLRRAEIFERLGNVDQARLNYQRFLEFWKTPEPEVRHLRDGAEERLRQLDHRP